MLKALVLILLLGDIAAFAPQSKIQQQSSDSRLFVSMPESKLTNRRDFGARILSSSSMVVAALASSQPAYADVSDGNALPQGAAQFGRVIRAKSDLQGIQKRVETGASEMDKTEWNNVGAFLRRVYGVSDDMKGIATGIYDATKKKRAAELIEELKKFAKAADVPTGKESGPEFLPYAKKLVSILDEFLDLLSDVPDEL